MDSSNNSTAAKHSPSASRLRERVLLATRDPKRVISASDIQALKLDEGIVSDIIGCLKSDDTATLSTGLFFLGQLLQTNPGEAFGTEFFGFLVKRIKELLHHESKYICYGALELFVWLRENYPDYRAVMLGYLASPDLGLRTRALGSYESFSRQDEISPLLRFATDDYAAEYAMMGLLRYDLRDLALKKIESITGKKFRLAERSEQVEGRGSVVWHDWSPFLKWWEENKTRFG